jgi:hypothetical protein
MHHAAAFCHGLLGGGCDRRDWRHIIYKVGEGYAHLRMEGTADFASVAAPIVSDGLSFSKTKKDRCTQQRSFLCVYESIVVMYSLISG